MLVCGLMGVFGFGYQIWYVQILPGAMNYLSARKRLIGQDRTVAGAPMAALHTPPAGFVNNKVQLLENISIEVVDKSLLDTPQKIRDPKRHRSDTSSSTQNTSSTSATLLEGDRREQ